MGKRKGSKYERTISKLLTKWWVGEDNKALWRADLTQGGIAEYPGDIAPRTAEAKDFPFFVECKNRKQWKVKEFVDPSLKQYVIGYWDGLKKEIEKKDVSIERLPALIFTKNHYPDYVLTTEEVFEAGIKKPLEKFTPNPYYIILHNNHEDSPFCLFLLDELLQIKNAKEELCKISNQKLKTESTN